MRFLFLPLILLAFPIAEIWLLIELGHRYGGWLLLYLLLVAILGWRLLIDEKFLVFGRLLQTLRQGGTPAAALFSSAKNMIAGVLLIFPGIISDVMAVILLLVPAAQPLATTHTARASRAKAANDDVIEGEFHRED
jgi:UPF0716 protein FxsA